MSTRVDRLDQNVMNNFGVGGDVNVANFLPLYLSEYFHYKGSLTTGGCEEAVNWVVFKTPIAIKERHLKALQSIKNAEGGKMLNNYRKTMPVNDRPVYYKGEKLMDMKMISRAGMVGLRSQQNAEVVEEDQFRKMAI